MIKEFNERIYMAKLDGLSITYTNSSCVDKYNEKTLFVSYKELDNSLVQWVDDRNLNNKQTSSEREFEGLLSTTNVTFESEVFFKIEGKKYFVDFFSPEYMIAFEIDGGYHKSFQTLVHDFNRDEAFLGIGITTLRYTNAQLTLPNIKSIINKDFRAALEGTFDISKYHFTTNTNKHLLKETTAQKALKSILKKIEKLNDNIELCIEVDLSHLLTVLQNEDYKSKANYWQDYEIIEKFYKLIEGKNIKHAVIYKGKNKKLRNRYRYRVKELNNYITIDCRTFKLLDDYRLDKLQK